ncbi:hypothetical protein HPULCUR_011501 [Helicostylum pulchrum]|uniref:Uncharacterized protein n=1 Tax=Helicostylum pulchrum TaxID=562976 RepID=A0ABP9YG88_9FUNG
MKAKFQSKSDYYKQEQRTEEPSNYPSDDENPDTCLTAFQKSYVSFPEFTSTNDDRFTEVITATAVPSFCSEPLVKPIWST